MRKYMSKKLSHYLKWAINKYGAEAKIIHEIEKRIKLFGDFEI